MNPTHEDLRAMVSGINTIAVLLAGYYAELIRLGVPDTAATALTVSAQNSLWPKPKAQEPDA